MTATTKDRQTPALLIFREIRTTPKANVHIPAGALVMRATATGLVENAADLVGMQIVGRAAHAFDNTAANPFPDTELVVEAGIFAYAVSAGVIALNAAAQGTQVTIVDNQTVGLASETTNDIIVGRIEEVHDGLYYIAINIAGA